MSDLSATVVIPTYNRAHLVVGALESALDQIEPQDEIILVDDGSTDRTFEVLEPYLDRIRYFRQENAGQSAARNFGVDIASKDLILFLDDDDEWLPGKLALHRALMSARPDVHFSLSSYERRLLDGSEITRCLGGPGGSFAAWRAKNSPGPLFSSIARLPPGAEDFQVLFGDLFEVLLHDELVITGLVAVRRNGDPPPPRFPEDIDYCEDWEFCSRLARAGLCAVLEKDLYQWREHPGPRMSTQDRLHLHTSRLKVLHNVWGQDRAFLAVHEAAFKSVVDRDRLARVHELLAMGEVDSAAKELDLVSEGDHRLYSLLSRLPRRILLLLLGLRRILKGLVRRAR